MTRCSTVCLPFVFGSHLTELRLLKTTCSNRKGVFDSNLILFYQAHKFIQIWYFSIRIIGERIEASECCSVRVDNLTSLCVSVLKDVPSYSDVHWPEFLFLGFLRNHTEMWSEGSTGLLVSLDYQSVDIDKRREKEKKDDQPHLGEIEAAERRGSL